MIERNAGMLNRRIEMQSPSIMADGSGGGVKIWSTLLQVWAAVKPLQGRELAYAQQRHNEVTHAVTVRFMVGITPDMRALYNGRVLRVLSVVDVNEGHAWLDLMCVEETVPS